MIARALAAAIQPRIAALRIAGAGALLLLAALVSGGPAAAASFDDAAAAWAAEDARILIRAAPRLADAALAPTFRAMESRVGTYADWVYGWLSSLLTAWDLAATAAAEARREIWAGRLPDPGSLHDRLAAVVQTQFDATVVHPARTEAAINGAWRRSMTRLSELDTTLAAERRRRIGRTATLLRADPQATLQRYGAPLLSDRIAVTEPPDLSLRAVSSVEDGAGGTADRVLVRSLRPLATRALSVTVRILLAPVAGGLAASPTAGANGLAAAAATMAAVSAGIWGLDYAANRLDSALTRQQFEAELRRLIRDAHLRASRIVRSRATAAACGALSETTACSPAQPVAAAGSGG